MIDEYLKRRDEIRGWFFDEDIQVFMKLDELQKGSAFRGDLLEIGAYHGKSAILLGYFTTTEERLLVCDLFGADAKTILEQQENDTYYKNLTYETFEKNYRRFHDRLPTILRCSSTDLSNKGLSKTFRLIHIDGSHQYDIVRQDIATARALLAEGGIVIFDDYRSFHAPGVAAAVWPEVTGGALRPLCITSSKMYALTANDHHGVLAEFGAWVRSNPELKAEREVVEGYEFWRLVPRRSRAGIVKKIYRLVRAARRQWR